MKKNVKRLQFICSNFHFRVNSIKKEIKNEMKKRFYGEKKEQKNGVGVGGKNVQSSHTSNAVPRRKKK